MLKVVASEEKKATQNPASNFETNFKKEIGFVASGPELWRSTAVTKISSSKKIFWLLFLKL